jgi:hypothetical protein
VFLIRDGECIREIAVHYQQADELIFIFQRFDVVQALHGFSDLAHRAVKHLCQPLCRQCISYLVKLISDPKLSCRDVIWERWMIHPPATEWLLSRATKFRGNSNRSFHTSNARGTNGSYNNTFFADEFSAFSSRAIHIGAANVTEATRSAVIDITMRHAENQHSPPPLIVHLGAERAVS